MALAPAYQIAAELPAERRALPVLKVLFRNSSRIHDQNAHHQDVMHPVAATTEVDASRGVELLRESVRAVDMEGAESRFAALARGPIGEAFNHLQMAIDDEVDVHRVVLSWRAWVMMQLAGEQYAHALLRQSVRYCVDTERRMREKDYPRCDIRQVLPRLLDEHGLAGKPLGDRQADDAWVESLAGTIYSGTREQAAEAAAMALAEGMQPEAIGEAISLAANMLVLHDPGRRQENSGPGKPPGCVHGDSVGVHASDASNAWRNIARVGNPQNRIASLIVGAYHTAGQTAYNTKEPYPYTELIHEVEGTDVDSLVRQADDAIQANDQARAAAWCSARRSPTADAAHLRPAGEVYGERGRRLARGKVLSYGREEFAATRPLPLAAVGCPGARHRERTRLRRPGISRVLRAAGRIVTRLAAWDLTFGAQRGFREKFRDVLHPHLGSLRGEAVAQHDEAKRARNGDRVGVGRGDLAHAPLADPLGRRVVEPHASPAAAAAGRVLPVAGEFDHGQHARSAAGAGRQESSWRVDFPTSGQGNRS
jgi:hypothetical protein